MPNICHSEKNTATILLISANLAYNLVQQLCHNRMMHSLTGNTCVRLHNRGFAFQNFAHDILLAHVTVLVETHLTAMNIRDLTRVYQNQ